MTATTDLAAWHARRAATLWMVRGYRLREGYRPQVRWWWDNRGRQPATSVVAQYVRRGRLMFRQDGKDREVGAGELLLFAYDEDTAYGRPPDRPAWSGHADHLQMDHVTLCGAGLREHWEVLRARHGSVLALPEDAPCLTALRALCVERDPDAAAMALRVAGFVAELARAVEVAAGSARPPVEQAVDAVLADPCGEHNLKAIAARCGCSREHLGRVFQERVGVPPATWMRTRRLERAIELLRETDLPISAVARRCGAGTVHRLARWTQEAHGTSPSTLHRRLRRARLPITGRHAG